MRSWLSKNRHVYWLLGLIALVLAYFVTQHLGLRYHVVHLPLDDRIPFCPVFVVFYILWYFYVPGCMLWACLRAKDVFCRQAAALFSGALLCVAVFVLYPTCIDFRPAAEGRGVFLALCRLIYAHDAPVNVFPSLHCYEALVLHLVTFRTPPLRARKALRLASFVLVLLICRSTLFVKQHAFIDVLAGLFVGALGDIIVYVVIGKKRDRLMAEGKRLRYGSCQNADS